MNPELILLLLGGVLILGCAGILLIVGGSLDQAAVVRAESGGVRGSFRGGVVRPLDQIFQQTRAGRSLGRRYLEANLRSLYPLEYSFLGAGAVVGSFLIANSQVTVIWALLIAGSVFWLLLGTLKTLRERQYRLFLLQLPELSRILANSTSAGLSIRSALEIAASEMSEPAGRELAILNNELAIGSPLDVALERLEERIPGRDLSVLIGTLVISQRSGGSLITALRGMAQALEDRKETTREVRTLMTQASFTGYMVVIFGVGLVLIFNWMYPGLLYELTSTLLGQIALIITGSTYVVGIMIIRRITKVKI